MGPARTGETGGATARSRERRGAATHGELARRTYRSYCRSQAAELLRLVPSDAVRALYREARQWAVEREVHDGKDPMATLLRYCEHILPLPPFRDWVRDATRNSAAHVRALGRRPDVGPDVDPFPAEVRTFEARDGIWNATLGIYRTRDAWRGFVAFDRGEDDEQALRTAEIFREETPADVRSRFRAFDPSSLRAFLRSVRP